MAFSQSSAQESKPGTGAISGRVTLGGNAARGVTVMAIRENSESRRSLERLLEEGFGPMTVKAKTDEEGKYRFNDLSAAAYRVFVYAPSMVGVLSAKKDEPAKKAEINKRPPVIKHDNEDEDGEDGDEANQPKVSMEGPQRYIELADGQTAEDINFSLARGGVITGRVTFADGRPVIGQTIIFSPVRQGENPTTYSLGNQDTFMTDDRGVYRVYGLPDGRYKLSVDARGETNVILGNQGKHKRTYYPSVTDEASATPVEVTGASEVRGIDIKLGAAAKTFVVTGRVVDADTGKAVPNVSVVFERARNTGSEGNSQGFTEANAKGEFRFESVSSGSYRAYSLDGLFKQSEFYGEACKFEVKDGNLSGVVLKMRRGATVSGVVALDGATDAQAMGRLAQQTVSAISGDDKAVNDRNEDNDEADGLNGMSIAQSPIAPDGSFALKGLKAGRIQISMGTLMSESGYAISRIERGGVEVQSGLELRPNETITDLRIVVAQKNCVLRGQVRVEGGNLPKNARLQVSAHRVGNPQTRGFPSLVDQVIGGSTQADADGQFKFDDLIPGEYEVSVIWGGKLDLDEDDPRPPTVKQSVFVTSDREAEVVLVLNLKSKK
jgi:protocatechuate 3,4-dioxygenase beta subunit